MSVHALKTRLIEFGRHAARRRAERGLGKPETFNFLGFTHICGRTRNGAFALQRLTRRDRMQAALCRIKSSCIETGIMRSRTKGRSYGRWCRGTSRITLCPPTPDA